MSDFQKWLLEILYAANDLTAILNEMPEGGRPCPLSIIEYREACNALGEVIDIAQSTMRWGDMQSSPDDILNAGFPNIPSSVPITIGPATALVEPWSQHEESELFDDANSEMETDSESHENSEQPGQFSELLRALNKKSYSGKVLSNHLLLPTRYPNNQQVAFAMSCVIRGYRLDGFKESLRAIPTEPFSISDLIAILPDMGDNNNSAVCAGTSYWTSTCSPLLHAETLSQLMQRYLMLALQIEASLSWIVNGKGKGGRKWQDQMVGQVHKLGKGEKTKRKIKDDILADNKWANRVISCYRAFGPMVLVHPAFTISMFKDGLQGPQISTFIDELNQHDMNARQITIDNIHRRLIRLIITKCAPEHVAKLMGYIDIIDGLIAEGKRKQVFPDLSPKVNKT